MHPDLLNNSLFLHYYHQWQQDPKSILFAPIAEYLLHFGMIEDAIKVCQEGLKHHPDFVSGRLSLAKALFRKKELSRAKEELRRVLAIVPNQEKALELMERIQNQEEKPQPKTEGWQTLTMAKLYAAQGYIEQAREVFEAILQRDPQNEEARRGLASLGSGG